MFNLVVLVGRLGRDPELSVTSGGIPLCKFSIAVDRDYKKSDGDRETDWIDIVAWRQRAEFAANYLKKGSLVLVRWRRRRRNAERRGRAARGRWRLDRRASARASRGSPQATR